MPVHLPSVFQNVLTDSENVPVPAMKIKPFRPLTSQNAEVPPLYPIDTQETTLQPVPTKKLKPSRPSCSHGEVPPLYPIDNDEASLPEVTVS